MFRAFEVAGYNVTQVNDLPGLAEYRNGGLFVDLGVIKVREQYQNHAPFDPSEQIVIEWRALTVALLDRTAHEVRKILNRSAEELPLAAVLEGGTWFAGRKIAASLRPDSSPPIPVLNKGNVF